MSAIHRQLPQYAFPAAKRKAAPNTTPKARPVTPPAHGQQQGQVADSEPTAVPGYN